MSSDSEPNVVQIRNRYIRESKKGRKVQEFGKITQLYNEIFQDSPSAEEQPQKPNMKQILEKYHADYNF